MFQALPVETSEIVVTSSRAPQAQSETAASTTIITGQTIERLGEPLLVNLLRLTPSAAVAASGPAGSLTEVRIRGAEANHTLLFIDGVRANDPAAGNVPRFELLNSDLFSRMEVVRGPQSALWGSEALGGVVAVGSDPGAGQDRLSATAEAGSFGFRRAAAQAHAQDGALDVTAAVGLQRARGIDSFDGEGDQDGYRNLSGRMSATWRRSDQLAVGGSAFALSGQSEFDGYSPVTFLRADTLESTRNRLAAVGGWARFGAADAGSSGKLTASLLGSSNRNLLDGEEVNRTKGKRATIAAQGEHRFQAAGFSHVAILAAEHEHESFRATDVIYGGATNQQRDRGHQSLTAEWRADSEGLHADVAIRHDIFSRFKDATSLRAALLGNIGGGFALAASYAEGIAQPSFFDLYGFFPGSFAGNPDLKPESSRGVELSGRYHVGGVRTSLTAFRQRLHNEIVDVFDSTTFQSSTANRDSRSRRSGIEFESSADLSLSARVTVSYAYLKASEPDTTGTTQVREVRRPRHSGAVAIDGAQGPLTFGASLAYTGERADTDFDLFPARSVRLDPYWLAGARLAYRVSSQVELFGRVANAFDDRHQDVVGYRKEGRSIHGGIRLAARR